MAQEMEEDDSDKVIEHKSPPRTPQKKETQRATMDESDSDDDEEDEEDDEPRLKYVSLTKSQGHLYRNGDAVSAFLVAGDKMIVGTHNGNVHIFSLPSFTTLRTYHAHTASITAISISPNPPPLPTNQESRHGVEAHEPTSDPSTPNKKSKQQALPNIPSNSIHIATASIDGNVCVYSLLNPEDVILRKFGRPVHAVALSPNYKSDRTYISGGKAGNLVLTVGGQAGKSSQSNTDPNVSIASSWLGTIGLGSNSGTDTVLHSGEGNISTIKWSLSGRFIVWVNEYGVKTMRTNLHLEANEIDYAWKRISHTDRPDESKWKDMSGVWMARAEWIDEEGLELEGDEEEAEEDKSKLTVPTYVRSGTETGSIRSIGSSSKHKSLDLKKEKLIVGWGDAVWIINLIDGLRGAGKERRMGKAEITSLLRFDCIVSGVSLYTPNLLLVLAYITPDEDESKKAVKADNTPRRGITRRQNALQPEMRIIDITTKEEVCVADTLNVSRFESLTAADYHLGMLPVMRASTKTSTSRGALEVLGTVGTSIWDASLYSTKLLGSAAVDATLYSATLSAQLFKTGTGLQSSGSDGLKPESKTSEQHLSPSKPVSGVNPALLTRSMKVFIQSPYDCVLAMKPTRTDHINWLVEHELYEEAWNEIDSHPEAVSAISDRSDESSIPGTPTKTRGNTTLFDFLDDTSSSSNQKKHFYSQAEKEKRRLGDKWIQQLINAGNWTRAGQVCGKVVGTPHSWEHWATAFAEANHHADIVQYIPTEPSRPPISSLVYELMLGHYISHDRPNLPELLDKWPPDLFEVESIISLMDSKLRTGEVTETTFEDGIQGRDWRILMDGLAKLYLADGKIRESLKCYIKLQDADIALTLIRTHHLVETVSDDIPGLLLLRISKHQQQDSSIAELEELSIEPVRLLVSEAHHGVVKPGDVVKQLKPRKDMQAFLYFYFRALWQGDTAEDPGSKTPTIRDSAVHRLASEGKSLVNDFADTALELFAKYNRELLYEFLKSSSSYDLSVASTVCKERDYIPEYVYVLAKEGRTKDALFMIIEKLDDVSQAIAFAREQDDADLWEDLLNYSMNKPAIIRALLEEAGTSIDPIALIRKIPEGLEIMGLRESLTRMVKEYELQYSISEGVARVFRGEVAGGMARLRSGQQKGVRFDIPKNIQPSQPHGFKRRRRHRHRVDSSTVRMGHCNGCGEAFENDSYLEQPSAENSEPLLSFSCTHMFHLSCILRYNEPLFASPPAATLTKEDAESEDEDEHDEDIRPPTIDSKAYAIAGRIGPKVRYAEVLSGRLGSMGCPLDVHKVDSNDSW